MVCRSRTVGAVLPGDFKIERRKIRGVVSEGMLCSPRELGLGDDHGGILALAAPTRRSAPTSARCSASTTSCSTSRSRRTGPTRWASSASRASSPPTSARRSRSTSTSRRRSSTRSTARRVVVDAPDRCPRFVALVAGVTMGASPDWMQRRLALAGMRPISNVVDVTNYVMLERCRPLHAFDLGRLAGRGIVVRLAARRREDDDARRRRARAHARRPPDLRRASARRRRSPGSWAAPRPRSRTRPPRSSSSRRTSSRRASPRPSKRLGLRSEASARFERGRRSEQRGHGRGAGDGAARARWRRRGRPTGAIDVYPQPVEPARITVRTERVNQFLGTELADAEIAAYLAPLGIDVQRRRRDRADVPPRPRT